MPIDQPPEMPQTFIGLVFAVMAGVGGFFSGRRSGRKNFSGERPSDAHIEGLVLKVIEREKEKERYLKEAISAALDRRLNRLENPEED